MGAIRRRMKSHRALDTAILMAATALTRFPFRSHYLYDVDSVNFALALRRFDPSVHQPHPPGYFLYVCLGRIADLIFHDANAAFVAISIVFSCGAAAMIYVLADRWFDRKAAAFAGLLFVFSPLAWFHGTVALTYVVEAFCSGLTGYLCWRIYCGEGRLILPGAAAMGIAAGFRPSSLLLLGPLFLFSLRKTPRVQAAAGIGALALATLAWFIPMIQISGGKAYLSSLLSLWLTVPSRGTFFNSSPFNSLARAGLIIGIYFLCFGCFAALPLHGLRNDFPLDRRKAAFTLMWIAPGVLFFTFIFLKFVNSGYLLVLSPPLCAWMGLWASRWWSKPGLRRVVKILIIVGCAAANTIVFLSAPLYCSYASVRQFEKELDGIIRTLPQAGSPRDTMIVGFDSHFLGYRHAGYYLPEYLIVQFPAVALTDGIRVFTMQHGDTRLEGGLPATSAHNFVLFPLPAGDRTYSDYEALVRKRFPAGALHTIVRGGHEFTMGPATDLRFLFPFGAPLAGATVLCR